MDLAQILGTVVSTRKVDEMRDVALFVIQPLDEHLQPAGKPLIASDSTGRRGRGEVVYFVASGDAVYTGPEGRDIPVDAAIIGIVDSVYIKK